MRLYLDASVLVGLLVPDALSARADAMLRAQRPVLLVSDFAAAEFASALGRRVRVGELTPDKARTAFAGFDAWTAQKTRRVETMAADVRAAEAFLRRLDLTLRAPDAVHVAIAQRTDAALATFDERMAIAARALGLAVLT